VCRSLSDEWREPKGLAISFAVPICAQEQDTVDPEMRQQIDAVQMKFGEAFNRHDVARYGSSIHAGRRSVVAFRFVSS
jgi:hypothetical protein